MAVYEFARVVAPDGVNPARSTALTVKYPGTSTNVTLYTDPTLATVLSSAGAASTNADGFARFFTNGVPAVDLSGTGVDMDAAPLNRWDAEYAPLATYGFIPPAYALAAEHLLAGSPTAMRRANMALRDADTDTDPLTTQVMLSVAVPLFAGDVITNITFKSGATAADTPTNWWFALYSSAATPALLAQTADQTTTAWAANTVKTLALATPQTISTTAVYFASIMMKATDLVSLIGRGGFAGANAGVLSGDAVLSRTSGSSLTTTAPPTITSATTVASVPYVVLT